MFNISMVIDKLVTMINESTLSGELHSKEAFRDSFVNTDPNKTPWLCIYKGAASYEPRTLGRGNWEVTPSIRAVLQVSNISSAVKCSELLDALVKRLIKLVTDDITIKNTVDMTTKIGIEYGYIETERHTMHFQSAVVTFELEVKT